MKKSHRVFLDTSVIFAAVLSETGGSRKLFHLSEAGVINLIIGPNVLRECDEVVRRKALSSLPDLAYLLDLGLVDIASSPTKVLIDKAASIVRYRPDSYVLAEAMGVDPDWFVTQDKEHFLKIRKDPRLTFNVGTLGDFIQALTDELTQS